MRLTILDWGCDCAVRFPSAAVSGRCIPGLTKGDPIMFQVSPLPAETFSHLFSLPDDNLDSRGIAAVRYAGAGDRFPCRVSLRDARPGERALLLNAMNTRTLTPCIAPATRSS